MSERHRASPSLCYVGGEDVRFRIPLLKALRDRGFRVGAAGSEAREVFDDHGVPYTSYPLARGLDPIMDLRSRRELHRLFEEIAPAIVHGFDTKPAILAPVIAQRVGVPVRVRTITGMGHLFSFATPLTLALRPVYRLLQRRGSAASTHTVFQNSDDRDYFLRRGLVPPGQATVIPGSGVEIDEAPPDRREVCRGRLFAELGLTGRNVVLMVSRRVRAKGVLEFARAAEEVRREIPDTEFLLVGPAEAGHHGAVSDSELLPYRDHLRILGPRSDVADLLAASDVFVLPSYYREGIPRVLLEAGAAGLPLITTDMPGCREVVEPEVNGLLVPPRDAAALAASIRALVSASDAVRRGMGERSVQHVRNHFSLERIADAHAHLYWSACGHGRGSTGAAGEGVPALRPAVDR